MTALNLQTAQAVVSGALKYARDRRFQPLGVAVLDARGALIAYAAEDGTSLRRQDIALAKANGALGMGLGSRTLAARAKSQPVFYSALANVIQGGLAPAPGGVLVRDAEGVLLGAVGVSGDVSDNDEAAALAGIEWAGFKADPGRE
ncbi:MAG TPA: heme-binding protein [Caulobacteraceae bacterium]